ncbi:MAG TPA: YbjN domain-containing protein [Candidatus Avacidaminococcus intestinavium]|uniref:YbjN domain-containing protein n=1 Tax=Candidatus Avacidaminococcus intestinavium TaxID=2840684 RepID=A0A9D1SLB3_9FIRM|nr:YbjN domain-containing protein [Candidatus Avacidaminococcus intestinavium]
MSTNQLNEKAVKFQSFLAENKLNYFGSEIRNDELKSVLFRTELPVNGNNLPLLLLTDDSIYTMIKILVVPKGVTAENREALATKINAYNVQYKIFKYTLTEDNDIVLDISVPALAEHFDEKLIMSLIDIALKHLTEEYADLMRIVWSKSETVKN